MRIASASSASLAIRRSTASAVGLLQMLPMQIIRIENFGFDIVLLSYPLLDGSTQGATAAVYAAAALAQSAARVAAPASARATAPLSRHRRHAPSARACGVRHRQQHRAV